jgi:hypothetical protein
MRGCGIDMSGPHILQCPDGSILMEWIMGDNDYRFYISIEEDPSESSWGFVAAGFAENGDFPKEIHDALGEIGESK